MPAMATPPPLPSAPVWCEVGRPSPGEAQDWATWVAPLGEGGDALYRSLVLADGAIAVTVELHARGASGTRLIHRGRCGLPRDPNQTAERVRLLLGAADRAAAKAVEAHRGGEGAAAAGDGRPTPRRVPDGALRDGGERDGGASAERHERGDRIREHARPEAATAA
jgi:hypothetical protein